MGLRVRVCVGKLGLWDFQGVIIVPHEIFPSEIMGAHHALCPRCAKSGLSFTTGSYGSQGPECCSLQPLLAHQGFLVLV